jgi:hypothetical protein
MGLDDIYQKTRKPCNKSVTLIRLRLNTLQLAAGRRTSANAALIPPRLSKIPVYRGCGELHYKSNKHESLLDKSGLANTPTIRKKLMLFNFFIKHEV